MKRRTAYSYGCVMAVLPKEVAKSVRDFAASIPDADIFTDGSGEMGREDDPHITVKYGLHTSNASEVKAALQGLPPLKATLGRLTAFHNPDFVVLKLGIRSPDLIAMNRLICDKFEFTDKHPDYRPHATVAYLKHRPDDPYWYNSLFGGPFEGKEVVMDTIDFSPAEGPHTKFKLKGGREEAIAERVAMLHLVDVECGPRREKENIDLYIELYGTGRLPRKYEEAMEKHYGTTDKRIMMKKAWRMKNVVVLCENGDVEIVNQNTGKKIKKIASEDPLERALSVLEEALGITSREREARAPVSPAFIQEMKKLGFDFDERRREFETRNSDVAYKYGDPDCPEPDDDEDDEYGGGYDEYENCMDQFYDEASEEFWDWARPVTRRVKDIARKHKVRFDVEGIAEYGTLTIEVK